MRINPIGNTGYNNRAKNQSFGAFLLNRTTITDKTTGKPVDVDVIEFETERRELKADLRLKNKNKISGEEFNSRLQEKRAKTDKSIRNEIDRCRVDAFFFNGGMTYEDKKTVAGLLKKREERLFEPEKNILATELMDELVEESGDSIYTGDFKFVQSLAQKEGGQVAEINKRMQDRLNPVSGAYINLSSDLQRATGGKMQTFPQSGEELLDQGYKNAINYKPESDDHLVYITGGGDTRRQRVLAVIEHQKDGNYRDLNPETKVYAMSEIYTDRLTDIYEKRAAERYDMQMRSVGHSTVAKQVLSDMNMSSKSAKPCEIRVLESLDDDFSGVEEALLDSIEEKSKYAGEVSTMWVSRTIEHNKDFVPYSNGGQNLLKEGYLKRF